MVFSVFSQTFYIKIRRNTPPGVQNSDVNSDFNFTQAWQRAVFFAFDRASGAGYSVSRTEGTRVPEKYVLPIVMLVAWPLHVAFVRVAIEGVSVASLMQVAGRFLISTGSDKIGRKGAMLLCFAITILAIVLLTFSKGIVYVVCFWLLSFTYGGTAATMPSLTTDYLGSENAGLVCSLVMIGFGVASVGTSFLAKAVNTSMAFILAGVIAIVGILVTLALPKLGKAEQ